MEHLTKTWGASANVSVQQLKTDPIYWNKALYENKMLVLRGLHDLTKDQLWNIHTIFGTPWSELEYRESLEGVQFDTPGKCVTVYGNHTSKKAIGDKPMPWHRDIPWHRDRRYPIRTLYPVRLENNVSSNTTRFCDADVLWQRIRRDGWDEVARTHVKIQNWYQMVSGASEPQTRIIPLVEQHPLTKRWSVLLNSFGYDRPELSFATARTGTWILDAYRNGQSVGLEEIERLHQLVCTDDNVYEHEWQPGDLVLFDNASGVFHNRGRIVADDPSKEIHREFWRLNLKHSWQV